ncbi:MAG: hypothetical protein L6R36_002396 [Xanthoria steineri]|nr:MAG: hypothetical protein L6R36_002396 [Xanthoria steineri]
MKPASLRPFLPRPALRRRQSQCPSRAYAIQAPGAAPTLQVFDSRIKQIHKERAAANADSSRRVDYLRDEIASRLCERLLDINRHFPSVLDLGANACNIARILTTTPPPTPTDPPLHTRLTSLTSADWSPTLLNRDAHLPFNAALPSHTRTVLTDPDTAPLPFAPHSFSAVLSSLSLHWINDLPSLLAQIATILKPDSPFLAAIFGGDSLFELRTSLQLADLDRRGGVATHVSPLADVRDVGGLLQKAGFKLLTVDVDDVVVEYPHSFALMQDLQAMGESNAALVRETNAGLRGLGRDVLLANEAIYRELHGGGGERGGIPATWRVIYMIGWTPGEGQPVPLARGSGDLNIKDILEGGAKK